MQHHKYSLSELEDMMPWEREIYGNLLIQWIEEENKRIQEENLKISRQRAKALGMTMREYETHLRSKMLKSQRKRIFGF